MGSKSRFGLTLLSLLCISGAIVMLFLLVLAGSYDRDPLNRIFFLRADTRGIPGAPDGVCHWTLYNFCDSKNGLNTNCRPNAPAYPFDPVRNFDTTTNIPSDLLRDDARRRYFHLSRTLFAFYLLATTAAVGALATGATGAHLAAAGAAAAALFCASVSAAVMTACFVLARDAWRRGGREAGVGVKAFALTWAVVALVAMAAVGFLVVAVEVRGRRRGRGRVGRVRSVWKGGAAGMRGAMVDGGGAAAADGAADGAAGGMKPRGVETESMRRLRPGYVEGTTT